MKKLKRFSDWVYEKQVTLCLIVSLAIAGFGNILFFNASLLGLKITLLLGALSIIFVLVMLVIDVFITIKEVVDERGNKHETRE